MEDRIKCRLQKLEFRGSAAAAIGANGFDAPPVLPIDTEQAGELNWQQNDPIDRMLVAHARRLALTLATAGGAVRTSPQVAQIWAG